MTNGRFGSIPLDGRYKFSRVVTALEFLPNLQQIFLIFGKKIEDDLCTPDIKGAGLQNCGINRKAGVVAPFPNINVDMWLVMSPLLVHFDFYILQLHNHKPCRHFTAASWYGKTVRHSQTSLKFLRKHFEVAHA